jgi:hypothetical protein
VYCFIGLDSNQLSASRLAIFLVKISPSRVFSSLLGARLAAVAARWGVVVGQQVDLDRVAGFPERGNLQIAGPLRPRWVNSMFSRKLVPLQLTRQSTEVPDSSVHSSLSWSVMVNGTSPARVGSSSWPNWLAT